MKLFQSLIIAGLRQQNEGRVFVLKLELGFFENSFSYKGLKKELDIMRQKNTEFNDKLMEKNRYIHKLQVFQFY